MKRNIFKKLIAALCIGVMLLQIPATAFADDGILDLNGNDDKIVYYDDDFSGLTQGLIVNLDTNENTSYDGYEFWQGTRAAGDFNQINISAMSDTDNPDIGTYIQLTVNKYANSGRTPKITLTKTKDTIFENDVVVKFKAKFSAVGEKYGVILKDEYDNSVNYCLSDENLIDKWLDLTFVSNDEGTTIFARNTDNKLIDYKTLQDSLTNISVITMVDEKTYSYAIDDLYVSDEKSDITLTVDDIVDAYGNDISSILTIDGHTIDAEQITKVHQSAVLMTEFMGLPLEWTAYEEDGSICDRVLVNIYGDLIVVRNKLSDRPIILKAQAAEGKITGEVLIQTARSYYNDDFSGFDRGTIVNLISPTNTRYGGYEFFVGSRDGSDYSAINISSMTDNGNAAIGEYIQLTVNKYAAVDRTPKIILTKTRDIAFENDVVVKLKAKFFATGEEYGIVLEDEYDSSVNYYISDENLIDTWLDLTFVSNNAGTLIFASDLNNELIDYRILEPSLVNVSTITMNDNIDYSYAIDDLYVSDEEYTDELTIQEIKKIYGNDISEALKRDIASKYSTYDTNKVCSDITLMNNIFGHPLSWSAYEADRSVCKRVDIDDDGYLRFDKENYSTDPITLRAQTSGGELSGEAVIIPALIFEEEDDSEIIDEEKYAILISSGVDESGNFAVKLFTQDGEVKEYKLAQTINYWAYDAYSPVTISDDHKYIVLSQKFVQTYDRYNIPLCKFKLNANGKVAQLYMAVSSENVKTESDALEMSIHNLRYVAGTGNFIAGYMLRDQIIGFEIPTSLSDFNDEENFRAFKVNKSNYISADGVPKDFVLGDFSDRYYANVLVEFKDYSNGGYRITDYGTAEDNPCIIVKDVRDNSDGTYTVTGSLNGAEVSYVTDKRAVLYKMDSQNIQISKETYNASQLWNGYTDTSSLEAFLSKGDMVGVKTVNGKACVLLKMVDVNELVKYAYTGLGEQFLGTHAFSTVRDQISIGEITYAEKLSEGMFFDVINYKVYSDNSAKCQVVNLTADSGSSFSCKVEDGICSPNDIMVYGETEDYTGDMVFVRQFNGNRRETIIYRFNAPSPHMTEVVPDDGLPYRINGITLTDIKGNVYNTIPDSGSFIANIDITEKNEYTGLVYMIAVAYDENDSLVAFNYMYAAPLTKQRLNFGVNIQPGDKKIKKIKAFVWDNLLSMVPLSETAEIVCR